MYTRSKGKNLERFNPEIEKSCKANRKEKRAKDRKIMAEDQGVQQARNRALQEYMVLQKSASAQSRPSSN